MSNSENTSQTNQKKTGLSLRARLIIGVMLITGLSIFALSYYSFQNRRNTTNFIIDLVNKEVREQAEDFLFETVSHSSEDANQFFIRTDNDVQVVANYLETVLNQEARFQGATDWNAQEELTLLSENQLGNSINDPASILAPSSFELTAETAEGINIITMLDLIIPQTLSANDDLKAMFFISEKGVTHYYPNIDLANIAGDFDARQRAYFQAIIPETNPEKNSYWSIPYFDAADGNVVETHSLPIYDESGKFRGAVAADVDISTVTDLVNEIQVGETGYAFLLDPDGSFLVLPESSLDHFGLDEKAPTETGIEQYTIFETEADIQAFADAMLSGEAGLGTFTRDDTEYYLAYAPIKATGYSLGTIVPITEMIQLYLTVQDNVLTEETSTLQITIVISIVILLVTLLFSYVIGRIITQPLKQLTEAAEEVSSGNFDVDIDTTAGGEIGTLAMAFGDMTHQVQDLVGNLEQRVTDRTRALEASMEVSRSVSTILDQQQLATEVVEQVREAFDYYHVHIYLTDNMTNDLIMVSGTGKAGAALLSDGHKITHNTGLVGQAANSKTTVLVSNVEEEEGWLPNPLLPDTKAEIAVPILMNNQTLGVLDVQQNKAGSLTDIDTQLLELVANQIAIALRNARLYESVQTQAKREAIANAIGQRLQTADNIDSVLQIAAQELGKALKSQRATVQIGTPEADNNGRQETLIA